MVFFFLISALLIGCQSKSAQTGDLPEIDLSKRYPQKEIYLRSIADIDYLPLETTDEVLLDRDARIFYFSDKYILVLNQRLCEVFVFNGNGKHLKTVNIPRGQGPMDILQIEHIVFDDISEEIYVFDLFDKVLVYSLTGAYIRTMGSIAGFSSYACFLNFNEETFFCYQEYFKRDDNQPPEQPYFFVSKKDGSIVSHLNINLPVRIPLAIIEERINEAGNRYRSSWVYTFPVNRHFGQDFVIADISSDTVFLFTKNQKLTPLLIRTPPVVDPYEPGTVWRTELKTDKFIIFRTMNMNFERLKSGIEDFPIFLMYEFETGQINEIVSFVIDDFPSLKWESYQQFRPFFDVVDNPQKNMSVRLLDVSLLKEAQEENKLTGKLENLATTLDEEDNPVIMIVNFK